MNTKTMTVNRALIELKTLDARIESKMVGNVYIGVAKNSDTILNGMTREEIKEKMKSDYQSVRDLINYRDAIKSAVITSNANTFVNVGDKVMTIAEAIYQKDAMEDKKRLARILRDAFSKSAQVVEERNHSLEERFENYIIGLYGSKDKVSNDDIEMAKRSFYETNGYEVVDPIGISKEIEQLDKSNDAFFSEIDSIIVESNATTSIVVNW